MLTWTQESDGWSADGFRIELRAPRHWVLIDLNAEAAARSDQVTTVVEPLAEETTLSQCKREAALLAAARERSALRRSHARILLVTLAATLLLIDQSPGVNVIVLVAALYIGSRSLGVIVDTWSWRTVGEYHEVFFQ